MPSDTTHPELIRRLRSAEGHLRGITKMVETGAQCQDIFHQVHAVRRALDEINRHLIHHYLHECLRNELADPDPAVRKRAVASVIAFYGRVNVSAPLLQRGDGGHDYKCLEDWD